MGFEKRVLEVVKDVIGAEVGSFTCGSLFVECNIAEAIRLESALLETFRCGIILSRVGNESSFDFV